MDAEDAQLPGDRFSLVDDAVVDAFIQFRDDAFFYQAVDDLLLLSLGEITNIVRDDLGDNVSQLWRGFGGGRGDFEGKVEKALGKEGQPI